MKFSLANIICYISILTWVSCMKPQIKIDETQIRDISLIDKYQDDIFNNPEAGYNLIFFRLDNDKMVSCNGFELYDIYKINYKNNYPNFYNFVSKLLRQKIKLEEIDVTKFNVIIFSLNDQIMQSSLKKIDINYLEKVNERRFYLYPKNLDLNTKQTILFKNFLNNRRIYFDDYGGKFVITN